MHLVMGLITAVRVLFRIWGLGKGFCPYHLLIITALLSTCLRPKIPNLIIGLKTPTDSFFSDPEI